MKVKVIFFPMLVHLMMKFHSCYVFCQCFFVLLLILMVAIFLHNYSDYYSADIRPKKFCMLRACVLGKEVDGGCEEVMKLTSNVLLDLLHNLISNFK